LLEESLERQEERGVSTGILELLARERSAPVGILELFVEPGSEMTLGERAEAVEAARPAS
jgi:hypothetical protein